MNRQRRKALDEIHSKLMELAEELDDIKDELENIKDEEEEARDNMPESLWHTERVEAMDEAVNTMDYAYWDVYNAKDALEDAYSNLYDLIEPLYNK